MKKVWDYRVMGWFLIVVGSWWVLQGFWPMMPWAAITTAKGTGPTFLGCALEALPGMAAVFFGWIFALKANRLAH